YFYSCLSLMSMIYFFLTCVWHCFLTDLPSFPTRRSSDLVLGFVGNIDAPKLFGRLVIAAGHVLAGGDAQVFFVNGDRNGFVLERSEEHTSELQSRENLVCRLLLEKKKEKNTELIVDKKQT